MSSDKQSSTLQIKGRAYRPIHATYNEAMWAQQNPLLQRGEIGIEQDTKKLKIGDGIHHWNELDYYIMAMDGQIPIDQSLSTTSQYPVQNKTITLKINEIDSGKQDKLVSGDNIVTINGQSLLSSGDLEVTGLPDQTGQSGKVLSTNGTEAVWINSTDVGSKVTFVEW